LLLHSSIFSKNGASTKPGAIQSDEAATKLLFLALRNIEKDWKMPPRTWKQAANQFAIMFGERFTNAII